METIVANYLPAKITRQVLNGREYLVAPLSMIVPGVLAGSDGPIYYPEEENVKSAKSWNGMPLVVYHPTLNGKNVSVKAPGILTKSCIGFIKNSRTDKRGRLVGEGWFDVKRMQAVDPRVMSALVANKPIELSTGLFLDKQPAPLNANYKGRLYQHVARNYTPDHLAILPDQVGACSLNDGCGVLVNQSRQQRQKQTDIANGGQYVPRNTVDRSTGKARGGKVGAFSGKGIVGIRPHMMSSMAEKASRKAMKSGSAGDHHLAYRLHHAAHLTATSDKEASRHFDMAKQHKASMTTNSKGPEMKKSTAWNRLGVKLGFITNRQSPEDELTELFEALDAQEPVNNDGTKECSCGGKQPVANAGATCDPKMKKPAKGKANAAKNTDPEEVAEGEQPTANQEEEQVADKPVELTKDMVLNVLKGLTDDEFMSLAPESVKATVTNAQNVVNQQKAKLIEKLTANVKNDDVKKRLVSNYEKHTPEELLDMVQTLAPVANEQNHVVHSVAHYLGAAGAVEQNQRQAPTMNADQRKSILDAMVPPRMVYKDEKKAAATN